jgi:hypothetical protein
MSTPCANAFASSPILAPNDAEQVIYPTHDDQQQAFHSLLLNPLKTP